LRQWTDAEQVREKLLGAVLGNGEVVDTWGIGLGERLDVPPRRGIDLSCRQGLVKRTPSQAQYLFAVLRRFRWYSASPAASR
jgi:hypothetical protein